MMRIFKILTVFYLMIPSLNAQIDSTKYRNPQTAFKRSLLPSAGQFYNQQPIKGVVFGLGFLGASGAIVRNQQIYKRYQQAYLYKASLYGLILASYSLISVADLKRYKLVYDAHYSGREAGDLKTNRINFRRYRDISVLAATGVYALSILDAYISAQLSDFDVGESLSLAVRPNPKQIFNLRYRL